VRAPHDPDPIAGPRVLIRDTRRVRNGVHSSQRRFTAFAVFINRRIGSEGVLVETTFQELVLLFKLQ